MRLLLTATCIAGLCCSLLSNDSSAGAQRPTDNRECQNALDALLLNKRLVAKVTFPASNVGIDLNLDGKWNPKVTTSVIKHYGIGIDIGEPSTVTTLKLKGDLVEIHLNGGGFGTWGDFMTSSKYQRQTRATGSKAPGGSRVNLKFNRPITCAELTDAGHRMAWLDPLQDASALRAEAARRNIPPEWADAAAQKRIEVGMDKNTVFAVMGEPKDRRVDMSVEPPTEKWQYDLGGMKTRVITFKEGKVIKVDDL